MECRVYYITKLWTVSLPYLFVLHNYLTRFFLDFTLGKKLKWSCSLTRFAQDDLINFLSNRTDSSRTSVSNRLNNFDDFLELTGIKNIRKQQNERYKQTLDLEHRSLVAAIFIAW